MVILYSSLPKAHELMAALKITYDSSEWRLFIDSSKTSLKAVLLQNGNTMTSVPVDYVVHIKETYDNIKVLLKCINYNQHQWLLCGYLKVVTLVIANTLNNYFSTIGKKLAKNIKKHDLLSYTHYLKNRISSSFF